MSIKLTEFTLYIYTKVNSAESTVD